MGVDRREVERLAHQFIETVVLGGREFHPVEMGLEEVDEGQKKLAIEAVGIKPVRRGIRGRDEHGTALEKPLEQAAQDHRVGDVGDMQLIEAEQRSARGK